MKNNNDLIKQLLEKQEECFIFIVRRVKDKSLAEDILQDVNYKVVKSKDQYKDQKKIWPYLSTIIKNTITSWQRQQERQEIVFISNEEEYELYTSSLMTENNSILNMTIEEIMKIVKLYGPEVCLIFSLIHQGYDRKEIAEKTGKSLEEIHAIIDRCRKRFREWRKKNY